MAVDEEVTAGTLKREQKPDGGMALTGSLPVS